ncbi:MAG: MFS transporter [Pseudomonadota bacterium]|nr:MFS transporter [Pseudomonadota bacterium]
METENSRKMGSGETTPQIHFRTILLVLLPFGFGYYLSYLFRTVNVVIAPNLAKDLDLSAADLGFLTSIYFILFAAFQTPLGVILDRYGPRSVQIFLLVFAAIGSAMFAISDSMEILILARGMIGLGVSGCLMGALKANVEWFPAARLPLINSFTMTFGTFGALSSTLPVELLTAAYGWRSIFYILSLATVILLLLTIFIIPSKTLELSRKPSKNLSLRGQLHDLCRIYQDLTFWRIAVVTLLHGGVFLSYQTLWMGPWLADVAGYNRTEVANSLLFFNIGMFAGVIGFGALADKLQTFGIKLISVYSVGVLLSIFVQLLIASECVSVATILCAAFGFFGSSTLLVYALLGQMFPRDMAGKVNTAQNMLIFIGAFGVQWCIGLIINYWPILGEGKYDPAGHQAALFVIIFLEILAFLWFLSTIFKKSPSATSI